MIKKIIFALIPAVFFFTILEMGVRLSPYNKSFTYQRRPGSLFDHCVFWKPEPVERNPLGIYHDYKKQFRGVYHDVKKSPGVLRVICLGGSSTWGWPLKKTEQIYPAVLETLLNVQYKDQTFEVINAGVGGYSSFQSLMYLKYTLLEYEPDIITLCAGVNDNNNNAEIGISLTDKEYWERLQKKAQQPPTIVDRILNTTRNYCMKLRIYNVLDRGISHVTYGPPKQRVPIEDFEDNICALLALAEEYHCTVLLITEVRQSLQPNYDYCNILQKVSEKYDNAFFIDTRPFLTEKNCFVDDVHPTYKGHRIIAEVLCDAISRLSHLSRTEDPM